jgi:hypothetical protein
VPRPWLAGALYDVIALLKAEVAAFFGVYNSETIVSMRTQYKVHISFPDIVTTERITLRCREQVRARRAGGRAGRAGCACCGACCGARGGGRCLALSVPCARPAQVIRTLEARWSAERMQQQGVAEPLDWAVVVDKPHGSLRLLGSQKAWWMAKGDPKWVAPAPR